jgi:hypothetical protein
MTEYSTAMAEKHLTVPERGVREIAHELALKLARQRLAGITDIERQCRNAGARYVPDKNTIALDYLGRTYYVTYPDGEVTPDHGNDSVPIKDSILILDYLTRAGGTPPTGHTITYKELHDGINYYPAFAKRAIQPLVTHFGEDPERLVRAAAALGGRRADFGDAAVAITALPRVTVTLVLWRGDSEFPPGGSILFDGNAADYLSNDDIHALCENIAWRLVKLAKNGGG